MALPPGITTCAVTFNPPESFAGVTGTATLTIRPSQTIIWAATNTQLGTFTDAATADTGTGSISLPHVDQTGFVDTTGAAVKNWYYTASILWRVGQEMRSTTVTFQILTGQTSVALESIPTGVKAAPVTVASAPVTSVNGQTGAVAIPNYEMRGTGTPEAAVTANPGTYYTDTAGTNGAVRWIKTSGTGNTGWTVQYGDTGVRNIDNLITGSGVVSKSGPDVMTLRRVGQQVELTLPGYNLSAITAVYGVKVMDWPQGFTPLVGPHYYPSINSNGDYNGFINVHDTGLYIMVKAVNQGDRAVATWFTADPWPTTLPGATA